MYRLFQKIKHVRFSSDTTRLVIKCNPTQQGVHQLNMVATFTRRWIANMIGSFSSFFTSVISREFGGGGTQRLKERNKEDSFLSYGKKRICG
jgi:hypothetical protein